jgi:hypothetical protein
MRTVVGAIGIALPVLLVGLDRVLFDAEPFPRTSLSSYWYSGVREIFVGGLCAIGVFLVTYKVAERSRENRLSTYSGLGAILVAFFPTSRTSDDDVPLSPLQDLLGEGTVEWIHFGAATVFLGSLAVISFYFGRNEGNRPPREGKRPPAFWRAFHFACAALIALALAFAALDGVVGIWEYALLLAEVVAVWAFGVSWLLKGLELDILRGHT